MTITDRLQEVLARADSDLEALDLRARGLEQDLAESRLEVGRLEQGNAELARTVDELRAEIAQLQAGGVSTRRTLFGACPTNPGGESLAAAQSVVTKWGHGAAVRHFRGALGPARVPEGASIVHSSFKPNPSDVITGRLDDAIRELALSTPAGHIVEIWHEADSKVRGGSLRLAEIIAAKNRFYNIVKATNPDVLVATTYTGWLFEPRSGLDPEQWAGVKADLLGADLDGINTPGVYPDFTAEIPRVVECAERWGYSGWCVPELGMDIQVAIDPDGELRAAWIEKYARLIAEAGAHYAAWFDYNMSAARTPGYALTTPAEVAAWRRLIA